MEIQASDADETIWQALHPAENVKQIEGETAEDVARWVAGNQTVAEGPHWRVAVWTGADADTVGEPAAIWSADDEAALV
ncbi:hypothetical protein I0C86_41040 [Plantactinospora sp. S1510]|uniref:Uncharacterized protein n=1 Tax=Plantactinospora alkalitolerans TaxID=2789879 RepID=A0ABS0H9U2_9ACTN|nr:hypothetical protein [Plantactinospora alkalitolerans]MBF9135238.1 hypothetical protein [Plantactinospora alkalitolerans]